MWYYISQPWWVELLVGGGFIGLVHWVYDREDGTDA